VEPQLKLFLRLAFVRSAVLVQTKGWQRSFQPWMKARSSASLLADGAALLDLLMLKDAGVDRSPHRSTWPWVDRRSSVAQVDWRRVSARIMPYVDIATPSIDDLMSTLQSRDRGTIDLVEECARCLVEAAVGGGGWPLGCRAGWYLVLTNRGQDEARDIRIKTQPLTEGEAWKILTGRDEDLILTPDVERLGGKHDVILFPIADALNTAGIVKCIVTWTDDRGEHTDTTTLQQKSSSEPAWNEAPSR
jgi:hypothetical protein